MEFDFALYEDTVSLLHIPRINSVIKYVCIPNRPYGCYYTYAQVRNWFFFKKHVEVCAYCLSGRGIDMITGDETCLIWCSLCRCWFHRHCLIPNIDACPDCVNDSM